MPLPPKIDYSGQKATLTVTEFRSAHGDALDRVSRGMEIIVTKNGKPIAVLSPPETVIDRSGKFTGRKPLTFGVDLGGEYAFGMTPLAAAIERAERRAKDRKKRRAEVYV